MRVVDLQLTVMLPSIWNIKFEYNDVKQQVMQLSVTENKHQ